MTFTTRSARTCRRDRRGLSPSSTTSSGWVSSRRSGRAAASIVQGDKQGTAALKESLAEAMGKFSPDRTVLPIPDPNFGGTVGRTLDASVADWTINMTPSPPEGAPNVLLVLIDDAGFGNPSTFGGPVVDAEHDPGRRTGADVQPLPRHRAVLAHAGRAADRPQPPRGGVRLDRRAARRRSRGTRRAVPKDCASFVRALQGNGYSTGGFRQVAPDPGSRAGRSRAVRPLAERAGDSITSGASSAARRVSTTP